MDLGKPNNDIAHMKDVLRRCNMLVENFHDLNVKEINVLALPKIIKRVMEFNKVVDLEQLYKDLQKYK